MSSDIEVEMIGQSSALLGRQMVHDERSRAFSATPRLNADKWPTSFRHTVRGPNPVPQQKVGCCTGVDACVKANTSGNRRRGVVLGLDTAMRIYSRATQLDPWPGTYPPQDTGSSGLSACKASKEFGIIDRYEWVFNGARGVLDMLQSSAVGVGTLWYNNMSEMDPKTLVVGEGGGASGGHQYTIIGWSASLRAFEFLCWWGPHFGRKGMARIGYDHLDRLLLGEHGDAHVTYRAGVSG